MLGQFVGFGQCCAATDHQEYLEAEFFAAFDPFFGQSLAFVNGQCHAFTGPSINHNALDALCLQQIGVALDAVVVDGAAPDDGIQKIM